MSTIHIDFKENQNYYSRKYRGLCAKLIYRKRRHYWTLQAGNRWVKKADNMDIIQANELLSKIYSVN